MVTEMSHGGTMRRLMHFVNSATLGKQSPRAVEDETQRIKYFTYVDVLTAHGHHASVRDCIYVGKKLEIEIFNSYELPRLFGKAPFVDSEGELRMERFPLISTMYFTSRHAELARRFTLRYVSPMRPMGITPYNLLIYFLNNADDQMRFRSRWFGNDHETYLPADIVRKSITWLMGNSIIKRMPHSKGSYQFMGI
jgi:hypothetical protein